MRQWFRLGFYPKTVNPKDLLAIYRLNQVPAPNPVNVATVVD
jgi:hypothetical protein